MEGSNKLEKTRGLAAGAKPLVSSSLSGELRRLKSLGDRALCAVTFEVKVPFPGFINLRTKKSFSVKVNDHKR
jgi:hypothetical protein